MFDIFLPAITGALITGVIGFLIIVTQSWHGRWTHDHTDGVQKFHYHPTPRIGGLAIMLGLLASMFLIENIEVIRLMKPLLIGGLIPFFFGFREDVTRRVSVRDRLLATMAGAAVTITLTGTYLHRLDIPFVDIAMQWWPLAVLVTIVAVSGVTNAINILDGFNGLASGVTVISFLFMAALAYQVGDATLMSVGLLIASVVLGFMALNYPFGKIFMGDAGAYFVGFLLAWVALLLTVRHPNISTWAPLLICAYPVVEVLYSMVRRMLADHGSGNPDSLHLHSLIKTRLVRRFLPQLPLWLKNALVAPWIWLCTAVLGWVALQVASESLVLMGLFAVFVLWYHVTYQFLLKLPVFDEAGLNE